MKKILATVISILLSTSSFAQEVWAPHNMSASGGAFTGNVRFNDDVKLQFGTTPASFCVFDTSLAPDMIRCDVSAGLGWNWSVADTVVGKFITPTAAGITAPDVSYQFAWGNDYSSTSISQNNTPFFVSNTFPTAGQDARGGIFKAFRTNTANENSHTTTGLFVYGVLNGGANNGGFVRGLSSNAEVRNTGGVTVQSALGGINTANTVSTTNANILQFVGSYDQTSMAASAGGGTISDASANQAHVGKNTTDLGTLTLASSYHGTATLNSNVSTYYGARLDDPTGVGTLAVNIGLYLPAHTHGTFNSDLQFAGSAPVVTLATSGTNGVLSFKDAEASPNTLATLTDTGTAATFATSVVNAALALQINGTSINIGGTLTNVAYLDQANVFSAAQTISTAAALKLTNSAPVVTLATAGVNGALTFKDAEGSPNTLATLTDGGSTGTFSVANLNGTTAIQLNGTSINTAGTLTDVAYKDQNNSFSVGQTITGNTSIQGALQFKRTASAAGNYSVVSTDYYVGKTGITGGGDTVTLVGGSSAGAGGELVIKDEAGTASIANPITISGNIDGASSLKIKEAYGSYTFVSNNVNWFTKSYGNSGAWTTCTATLTAVGGAGNTIPTYTTSTCRTQMTSPHSRRVRVYTTGNGGTAGAGTGTANVALPEAAGASHSAGAVPVGIITLGGAGSSGVVLGTIAGSATTISLSYFSAGSTVSTLTWAQQSGGTRGFALDFEYEVD